MKKIWSAVTFLLCFLLAFAGTALAAGAAAPEDGSILDMLRPVYESFAGGNYVLSGALALVLLVALVKRYVAPRVSWMQSDIAAAGMTLLAAFGASLGASLGAGNGITWAIVKTAAAVGAAAAGGYSLLKPFVVWLASKAPAWAQPILSVIMWVFDKPTAVDVAKKDGDAAVAATPSSGADGVIGKSTEVK